MLRLIGKMARQSEVVDIIELTPDEVVAKINDAAIPVTRASAIGAESIANWGDAIGDLRDAWKGKPDNERGVIFSEPVVGQFPVVAINRTVSGEYQFVYDDVPV